MFGDPPVPLTTLPSEEQERELVARYKTRRELIARSDEEIIAEVVNGRKEVAANAARSEKVAIDNLIHEQTAPFVQLRFEGKPLFDVGGGEEGFWHGLVLRGLGYKISGTSNTDLGFSEFHVVDPFLAESDMQQALEKDLERSARSSKENAQRIEVEENSLREHFKLDKVDGLSFLIHQSDEAGNTIMSSLNYYLISSADYLARLAQEAFRVAPVDGLFVTNDSPEISREAKALFPYSRELGPTTLFSKKPIPSEKLLTREEGGTELARKLLMAAEKGEPFEFLPGDLETPLEEFVEDLREPWGRLGFEITSFEAHPDDPAAGKVYVSYKK